ncbi:MAG: tRNA dihydrouridine synthase DusB [Firmicutes bacterium]|nr:tRNA dihydrouridine synthase DusB [Bacillota bacterium]
MADSLKPFLASLASPFYLAPMAGFSDSVYRYICQLHQCPLTYSEMISAKGLYYKSPGGEELVRIDGREGPVALQLFGSEPEMFTFAVNHLKDSPAAFFDINMGCPVPKVVKNGEGSALMRSPAQAAACVRAAVLASDRPVTVKIRKGFSAQTAHEDMSAPDFARLLEDNGAAAIAVHGRTREEYYSGRADWSSIKAVKQAVSVPVIGSGDVFSAEDAVRMLDETGCDAVMIARGARGNPWIFEQADALLKGLPMPSRPDAKQVVEAILLHLELMIEAKGEYTGLRQMRQHSSFYTKGYKGAAEIRARLNTAETAEQFLEALKEFDRQQ